MKQNFILSASIALALGLAPAALLAAQASRAIVSLNTSEAARITQVVNNNQLALLPKSHLALVAQAAASATTASPSMRIEHMQLVLKPSAARTASAETFIAQQHDPKSANFHQWLTPAQYGAAFGVVDSDVESVKAWLVSQGFTVNLVYPNNTQIDFSGTAAQVNQAFHTQENVYTVGGTQYLANASDISVPTALSAVVGGVMGMDSVGLQPITAKSHVAKWNATKTGMVPATASGKSQAVSLNTVERFLAPNDMATMYGIKQIRANGVNGKGINIAVVEDSVMDQSSWQNFVNTFNLGQYGGTFTQFQPAPASGTTNCTAPFQFGTNEYGTQVVTDAEWVTAIAPGANVWVATCEEVYGASDTSFGGTFIAATNLVNGASRPDVISMTDVRGEWDTPTATVTALQQLWAQADAEGISVFVPTGDSGPNVEEDGMPLYQTTENIQGKTTVAPVFAVNVVATSAHDTAVGGTDLTDIFMDTTSQYFAATPSVVGGSALSYVPEMTWNATCANGVVAQHYGYSVMGFCNQFLKLDYNGDYLSSWAASGGASTSVAKPNWQLQVHGAAQDQSRDVPDVALFAGSYGDTTSVIVCDNAYPCSPGFSTTQAYQLIESTEVSADMFAGIQALIDQGIAMRGLTADQGNAAPTLYALAAQEYGTATGTAPSSLAACSSANGTSGTSGCVFHNITTGNNSVNCFQGAYGYGGGVQVVTPNCYFYGTGGYQGDTLQIGLTTSDAAPTSYSPANKGFNASPGWSFAAGLGSVNVTNLLIAWRAFLNAPTAQVTSIH